MKTRSSSTLQKSFPTIRVSMQELQNEIQTSFKFEASYKEMHKRLLSNLKVLFFYFQLSSIDRKWKNWLKIQNLVANIL